MTSPAPRPQSRGMDWPRFYKFLGTMKIEIPTRAPGDPPDLETIGRLLVECQTKRTRLDDTIQTLQQRLGSLRRRLEIAREEQRMVKVHALSDPVVRQYKSRADRDLVVERYCAKPARAIAEARGKIHEYEAARDAARARMESLKAAKESLNALRYITLGQMDGGTI